MWKRGLCGKGDCPLFHIYSSRYCVGVWPVWFLKNLKKNDWLGKFSRAEISFIVISVWRSIFLASSMSSSFNHSGTERPLVSYTILDRYLGVTHILSA